MKRILILACALALVVPSLAHAQAGVNGWSVQTYQVWPNPQNTTLTADTLLQQAFGQAAAFIGDTTSSTTAGYNKQFTDSVFVQGARYVQLVAVSAGVSSVFDTILVAHYTRMNIGSWCSLSMASCAGVGQVAAVSLANNIIRNTGQSLWEWHPELDGSGTPHPIGTGWAKWRVRSGDVRGYTAASAATKSLTGAITIYAYVWR